MDEVKMYKDFYGSGKYMDYNQADDDAFWG